MTAQEVLEKLTNDLNTHDSCGSNTHLIVVYKDNFDLLHDYHSINDKSKVIPLTVEQVKYGLTPREWSSITQKIIKFQLEAEK